MTLGNVVPEHPCSRTPVRRDPRAEPRPSPTNASPFIPSLFRPASARAVTGPGGPDPVTSPPGP
jgi:hypothetical protein